MGELSLNKPLILKKTNHHPIAVSHYMSRKSKPCVLTRFGPFPEQQDPRCLRVLLSLSCVRGALTQLFLLLHVSVPPTVPSPTVPGCPPMSSEHSYHLEHAYVLVCGACPAPFLSSRLRKCSRGIRILFGFAHHDFPAHSRCCEMSEDQRSE